MTFRSLIVLDLVAEYKIVHMFHDAFVREYCRLSGDVARYPSNRLKAIECEPAA